MMSGKHGYVTLSRALDEVWCVDRALKVARITASANKASRQWEAYLDTLEYALARLFDGETP